MAVYNNLQLYYASKAFNSMQTISPEYSLRSDLRQAVHMTAVDNKQCPDFRQTSDTHGLISL